MAKELENLGAQIIAIKDMAGLLKPQAAYRLISELKAATDLPIHLTLTTLVAMGSSHIQQLLKRALILLTSQ